jgi:DNA-directed RNA polymerase subunit RPC12/RpoP
MGIRFSCPNGHKLNVKAHLAGKRAICPHCGSRVVVPDPPVQPEIQAAATSPVARALPLAAPLTDDSGGIDLLPSSILPHAPAEHAHVFSGSGDAIPESILAATVNTSGIESTEGSADSTTHSHHARGRRNQLIASVVLLLIVVLLAAALYWILTRPAPPPIQAPANAATPSAASKTTEPTNPPPSDVAAPAAAAKPAASPAATPVTTATDAAPLNDPASPNK